MRIAIMQPYFFPYVGYFALLSQVDRFVFYDDVNYIKQGWINRNRMMRAANVEYFTVPVIGRSSFKKLNTVEVDYRSEWRERLIRNWEDSYKSCVGLEDSIQLLKEALAANWALIGELAKVSIQNVAKYLNIRTEIVWSSSVYGNSEILGKDRILDICKLENADEYVNLPGGKNLYENNDFRSHGIKLSFIDNKANLNKEYSENLQLSFLHLIAVYGKEQAAAILARYGLESAS